MAGLNWSFARLWVLLSRFLTESLVRMVHCSLAAAVDKHRSWPNLLASRGEGRATFLNNARLRDREVPRKRKLIVLEGRGRESKAGELWDEAR